MGKKKIAKYIEAELLKLPWPKNPQPEQFEYDDWFDAGRRSALLDIRKMLNDNSA